MTHMHGILMTVVTLQKNFGVAGHVYTTWFLDFRILDEWYSVVVHHWVS